MSIIKIEPYKINQFLLNYLKLPPEITKFYIIPNVWTCMCKDKHKSPQLNCSSNACQNCFEDKQYIDSHYCIKCVCLLCKGKRKTFDSSLCETCENKFNGLKITNGIIGMV
jgi:hypothetical protein